MADALVETTTAILDTLNGLHDSNKAPDVCRCQTVVPLLACMRRQLISALEETEAARARSELERRRNRCVVDHAGVLSSIAGHAAVQVWREKGADALTDSALARLAELVLAAKAPASARQ